MSEQRVELDRPETYGAVDTQGMAGHLAGMPEQVRAAWQRTRFVDLPDKHSDIFSFIVIGNGGAALAGDMLRGFVAHTAQIPVDHRARLRCARLRRAGQHRHCPLALRQHGGDGRGLRGGD